MLNEDSWKRHNSGKGHKSNAVNIAVTNGYAKRDVIYMVVRKRASIVQHFLPESSTKHVTEHC